MDIEVETKTSKFTIQIKLPFMINNHVTYVYRGAYIKNGIITQDNECKKVLGGNYD